MAFLADGSRRDRRDIVLMGRRSCYVGVGPADNVARAEGPCPPNQAICGKHSGAYECRLESGSFDLPLDFREHGSTRVGLLEEWVRGLERGRKEDDSPDVF